jgi:uncharacterized protein YneR
MKRKEFPMNISITEEAANWYKNELNLKEGDFLRFFVRYGGCSNVQKGFSLGVSNDTPVNPGVKVEQSGIQFFIEEDDLWYFDGKSLNITYNKELDEPEFHYV